ncbi:MAG: OmpH family outer membrane protein [Candidatus Schekmanbacteria bacterium]|nr:OmpH family outer membrane protein [Candidatus Schekmanbacteria bacterium]
MKKVSLMLTVVFLMFIPYMAFPIEGKIGIVDLQQVLNDSKKGKEAIKMLESEFDLKKKDMDEKEKELQSLQDEMVKRAAFWSDKVKAEKEDEFNKKLKNWKRLQVDIKDEFERKNKSYTDKILADIIDLVKQVGKRDGYNIILEKQNAIYSSDVVDLTPRVIELYDSVNSSTSTSAGSASAGTGNSAPAK